MSPACEVGRVLIAACVTAMPAEGEPFKVNRSCVDRFSEAVRDAARACAAEHGIRYRINWRK